MNPVSERVDLCLAVEKLQFWGVQQRNLSKWALNTQQSPEHRPIPALGGQKAPGPMAGRETARRGHMPEAEGQKLAMMYRIR